MDHRLSYCGLGGNYISIDSTYLLMVVLQASRLQCRHVGSRNDGLLVQFDAERCEQRVELVSAKVGVLGCAQAGVRFGALYGPRGLSDE
jgi:hypothetical protein